MWAQRPEEQEMLRLVGIDGEMPDVTADDIDGLAVVNQNASGNKIDSFLERTIEYRARYDRTTGRTTADLRVEFTNTAPTRGYPDYVIGNLVEDPTGTNRSLVQVYSALEFDSVRVDDADVPAGTLPQVGYNVFSTMIEIAPGETVVLEADLGGTLAGGGYELAYRPQATIQPDQVDLAATSNFGRQVFRYVGELERRSVLSSSGVDAWRWS
jgi:hypothetical protein